MQSSRELENGLRLPVQEEGHNRVCGVKGGESRGATSAGSWDTCPCGALQGPCMLRGGVLQARPEEKTLLEHHCVQAAGLAGSNKAGKST